MRRSSDRDPDGVTIALAEHVCMYCAAAGLIAFVLYYSMQPTRVVNPGLAAYKPPPRTVITYAAPLKFEREAITVHADLKRVVVIASAGFTSRHDNPPHGGGFGGLRS